MYNSKKRVKKSKYNIIPIELFETKAAGVAIVDFMNSMFENLPSLLGVFRINYDPVLECFYLEIPSLRCVHLLVLLLHGEKKNKFESRQDKP